MIFLFFNHAPAPKKRGEVMATSPRSASLACASREDLTISSMSNPMSGASATPGLCNVRLIFEQLSNLLTEPAQEKIGARSPASLCWRPVGGTALLRPERAVALGH